MAPRPLRRLRSRQRRALRKCRRSWRRRSGLQSAVIARLALLLRLSCVCMAATAATMAQVLCWKQCWKLQTGHQMQPRAHLNICMQGHWGDCSLDHMYGRPNHR